MVSHSPVPPKAEGPDSPPPQPPLGPRMQRWSDALVRAALTWMWQLVLIAICPGLAFWTLYQEDRQFVLQNDLAKTLRADALDAMMTSAIVVVSAYAAVWAWRRVRGSSMTFGEVAESINRYAIALAVTPLLAPLFHRGIEVRHFFITLTLIVGVSVVFGIVIYRITALARPLGPRASAAAKASLPWLPVVCMVAIGVFYAAYVSHLALLDHRNLQTHIYDLGIYDNIFWRTTHGDFLGCAYCKGGKHVAAHFDPIIWIMSPVYRLAPRAETILMLQAVWLSIGVVPLYLLAKRRLGSGWFGVLLAGIYVLYPALHGANLFDFHSLTLVIPSLLWSIYLVDAKSKWGYAAVIGLMLLTREDMSLLACFVGAYAILRRRPIAGLLTIVASLGYLTFVKLYMMPDPGLLMQGSKEAMSYIYFYEDMIPHRDEGMKGLIVSLMTNPGFVLKMLVIEGKAFFFLALFVPLLFLPLLSGRKTVMMVYGFIFIGLASRKHVYSLHFQYSSVLFPILVAAMPDGIARVADGGVVRGRGLSPERMRWTLMSTALVATLLTSFKFGAFFANDSFKAGWNKIVRNPSEERIERYEKVRAMVDMIPKEAAVSSTSGLGPQISNRDDVMKWPLLRDADYLLLYTRGFKAKDDRRLDRLVNRGEFRLLEEGYGVELFERVPKEEREEARLEARENPRKSKASKGSARGKGRRSTSRSRTGRDARRDADNRREDEPRRDGFVDELEDEPADRDRDPRDADLDLEPLDDEPEAGIPADPRAREPESLIE